MDKEQLVKLLEFQFPDRNSVDLDLGANPPPGALKRGFQFPDRNSVDLDRDKGKCSPVVGMGFNSLIGILWI